MAKRIEYFLLLVIVIFIVSVAIINNIGEEIQIISSDESSFIDSVKFIQIGDDIEIETDTFNILESENYLINYDGNRSYYLIFEISSKDKEPELVELIDLKLSKIEGLSISILAGEKQKYRVDYKMLQGKYLFGHTFYVDKPGINIKDTTEKVVTDKKFRDTKDILIWEFSNIDEERFDDGITNWSIKATLKLQK